MRDHLFIDCLVEVDEYFDLYEPFEFVVLDEMLANVLDDYGTSIKTVASPPILFRSFLTYYFVYYIILVECPPWEKVFVFHKSN